MAVKGISFEGLFSTRLFYKLDQFSDAIINTEDGFQFKVHRLFLSKGSDYFQAFFRSNIGKKEDTITLELDRNILENILIFLYTGDIYLDDKNIANMIIASDYLLIDSLLMHCKHFAMQEISEINCVPLLVASFVVERLGIMEHCYRFVLVHFWSLVHKLNSDIAELPLNVFKSLLSDDSLGVSSEDTIWKAIVIWVEANEFDRLKNVPELLTCLRWKVVNYMLVSSIASHPIFKDNVFCQNLNLKGIVIGLKSVEHEALQFNLTSMRCPSKMYVFLRRKPFPYTTSTLEIFLTYDEQLDIWRKIGETDSYFHTLIALNGYIFMFNTLSNSMEAFDLIKKTWHNKNNIRTTRQSYWVVHGTHRIYAVGGYVFMSNIQLSDVENYDPTLNLWSYCAPIPSMSICGAAIVNERLYVVGYYENSENLEMKAFVYSSFIDAWSEIKNPKVFRTQFAIIGFCECLYIFGGRIEGNDSTMLVEKYDPKRDEWKVVTPLPYPYEQPHAVILRDKLMVYDNFPAVMLMPRFSPCLWNTETQMWDIINVFSPFNEIHRYEFCAIHDHRTLMELAKENRDPETEWVKTCFVGN